VHRHRKGGVVLDSLNLENEAMMQHRRRSSVRNNGLVASLTPL
jgi:hypothetical protein